jgi:hypothetical protein
VQGLQRKVIERNQFVYGHTSGVISEHIDVNWTSLTLNARATGFEALYEEYRIDKVVFEIIPLASYCQTGYYGVYLDRNVADGVVGITDIAMEQESTLQSIHDSCVMTWTPKEPEDREYILFATDTARAKLWMVSNDIRNSDSTATVLSVNQTDALVVISTTYFSLRGRST